MADSAGRLARDCSRNDGPFGGRFLGLGWVHDREAQGSETIMAGPSLMKRMDKATTKLRHLDQSAAAGAFRNQGHCTQSVIQVTLRTWKIAHKAHPTERWPLPSRTSQKIARKSTLAEG